MLRRNILICAAAILAAVIFVLPDGKQGYTCADEKTFNSPFDVSFARLNTISVPEKGITRDEMLRRFGRAHTLVMEYDNERQTDVTKFYYRIADSDLFMEFVSDWNQNHKIVDFSMKEGYYMLNFTVCGN